MSDILRDEQLTEELHQRQRQLQELREQENQLEQLREELATLVDRQRRFMAGREKLREELGKAMTRLESENYQIKKRAKMLAEMHELIEPYPEALEQMRPEHWNRERLDGELLEALGAVEQMERDLDKVASVMQWDKPGEYGVEGEAEDTQADFLLWLRRGAAFTLPLLLVLVVLWLLSKFVLAA